MPNNRKLLLIDNIKTIVLPRSMWTKYYFRIIIITTIGTSDSIKYIKTTHFKTNIVLKFTLNIDLKISLICDLDRIATCVHVDACNIHDTKMLVRTLEKYKSPNTMVDCLCDAGYVGQTLNKYCETKNYHLIVKPRKTRNKLRKTHVISEIDADHLKKFRNRIELLNQNIRRYRALMIKWVQNVSIYQCFLFLALLCISSYQIITTK